MGTLIKLRGMECCKNDCRIQQACHKQYVFWSKWVIRIREDVFQIEKILVATRYTWTSAERVNTEITDWPRFKRRIFVECVYTCGDDDV